MVPWVAASDSAERRSASGTGSAKWQHRKSTGTLGEARAAKMPLNALISPNFTCDRHVNVLYQSGLHPRLVTMSGTPVRHKDMWLCLPELLTVCIGCISSDGLPFM